MRSSSTTTTSISRSISSPRSYSSHVNYGGGMAYGGFGMGYGYSNGLLTGMIISNMMHPYGTVMYAGPGMYSNNALLYPDGRVVNQQGYLVGNYINGQFSAVSNGGMVAQQVPQDAFNQQSQQIAQPIIIQDNSGALVILLILGIITMLFVFAVLL